jgi:hypothetical protein
MPRETKAQKTTRISLLLGDYDEKSKRLRKLANEVDDLKGQIEAAELESGTVYGDWIFGRGTPRNNVDNEAVKEHYASLKLELPRKLSKAPIIVTPKASTKAAGK